MDDLSINQSSFTTRKEKKVPLVGKYLRKVKKLSRSGKIFVGVVLAHMVFQMVIALINLIPQIITDETVCNSVSQCDFTYETSWFVFMAGSFFMFHFGIDGVLEANFFEFGAFMIVCTLETLFALSPLITDPKSVDLYDYITIAVTVACEITYFILLYPIYQEYSWKFFKKVGGDPKFRALYKRFQQFKALLKIDFFWAIVLLITDGFFSPLVSPKYFSVFNLMIDIMSAATVVVTVIVGYFAIKREERHLSFLFFFLLLGQPAYIIGKTIEITRTSTVSSYGQNYGLFFFSAFFAIIFHMFLVIWTILCFRNFNKGLKNFAYLKKQPTRISSVDPETQKLLYG